MMSSLPSLLLIVAIASLSQGEELAKADKLFAARDRVESLSQAVAIAEKLLLRSGSDYEVLWRLSKYRYYEADREGDKAKKSRLFEAGVDAARRAIQANDKRVEGHFWLAANTGELADLRGALESLGMIKTIRREFETALAIDPAYENGASYLALGQMFLQLPRLLGGSDRRGMEMLENGYKAAASNAELKLALAERYAKSGKKAEARRLLESVLSGDDPVRSPGEREGLRTKAHEALERLK